MHSTNLSSEGERRCGHLPRLAACVIIAVLMLLLPRTSRAEDALSLYTVGVNAFQDQLYDVALQQFQRYLELYPKGDMAPRVQFLLAETLIKLGNEGEALVQFKKFADGYPDSDLTDDALYRIGRISYDQSDYAAAVEAFKRLLSVTDDRNLLERSLFWLGEGNYKIGSYADSLTYHKILLEDFPQSKLREPALYTMGWASRKLGDRESAVKYLRELITLFPQSRHASTSRFLLGESLFLLGRYEEASAAMKELMELHPSHPQKAEALYLLAESNRRLKRFDLMVEAYEALIKEQPRHPRSIGAYYNLGWAFYEREEYDKAAYYLQRFVDLAPGEDNRMEGAIFTLARSYQELEDLPQALGAYGRLVEKFPDGKYGEEALMAMGKAHFATGEDEKAVDVLQRLLKQTKDTSKTAWACYLIGESLHRRGQEGEALQYYKRAAGLRADRDVTVGSLIRIGDASFRKGDRETYIQTYRDLLSVAEEPQIVATASYRLAEGLYSQGKYEEALSHYDRVLKNRERVDQETLLGSLLRIGFANYRLDRKDDAVEAFKLILNEIEGGKTYATAAYMVGEVLFEREKFAEAVKYYYLALDSEAEGDEMELLASNSLLKIGLCYYNAKDYPRATVEMERLLAQSIGEEQKVQTLFLLGESYRKMGKYREALIYYSELQTSHPAADQVPTSLYNAAICYKEEGMWQEAINAFNRLLKDYPERFERDKISLELGRLHLRTGDTAAALSAFKEAARSPSELTASEAMVRIAEYHFGKEEYDLTISSLEGIESFDPEGNPWVGIAFSWLGAACEKKELWEEASRNYQMVLQYAEDEKLADNARERIKKIADYLSARKRTS